MKSDMTIGVVGSGLMGTGIAECAIRAGVPTVLVKATGGDVGKVRAQIAKSLDKLVTRGKLDAAAAEVALGLLTVTSERRALAPCGLVIECIVEDLDQKRRLFAELDGLLSPDAILASNTSTLRIADLAGAGPRARRTIGLHFFSPVPAMQLVELARLPDTDAEALTTAEEVVTKLGKTCVPVLDSTGFIVNRLLVPYLLGTIAAFEQGLGRPEHLDTAMRLGCNHPIGPLALADLIGLDVVYAMAKLLFADFGDARYMPPSLLRRMVQLGQLGKKSGMGFYDYSGSGAPCGNERLIAELLGGRRAA